MQITTNRFQGIKDLSSIKKCEKCNDREATSEDGLCDNCRYVLVLNEMVTEKAMANAAERTKRVQRR